MYEYTYKHIFILIPQAIWDVTITTSGNSMSPLGTLMERDFHGITLFLVSEQLLTGDPYRLVNAPFISSWALNLMQFVTTHSQQHIIVRFLF